MRLLNLLRVGAACTAAASIPSWAAFSGPLAPSQWTTTVTGPAFGSLVNTSAAPSGVTIIGGDDPTFAGCPNSSGPGFLGGCQISYTIKLADSYSFHWSYITSDNSPQFDSFGMLVDGNRIELVADGGDVIQSGDVTVQAASSFGWYINCTDCTSGAAQVTLSNITAVPEPQTFALLALGLATVGGVSRIRRRTIG